MTYKQWKICQARMNRTPAVPTPRAWTTTILWPEILAGKWTESVRADSCCRYTTAR